MESLSNSSPTILLIDNDPAVHVITRSTLEMAGFRVLSSLDSSQDFTKYVSESDVDLVLLDFQMPKRDGLAVLKELRSVYNSHQLPILMLSSSNTNPTVVQALNLGANDYISKLVDPSVLVARIHSHLRTSADRDRGFPTRYELGEKLGKGSMGTVFRARDTRLNRTVAVKILNSSSSCKEDQKRFEREARALAKFRHPNVVSIYDFGTEPNYYLVMNYVEGKDLTEFVGSPLKTSQVISWMSQLLQTLSAVHSFGLIHRDLKPSNIRLTPDGRLVVLDFGMAKWSEAQQSSLTSSGAILGTPAYLAPEELDSSIGETDQRTDIYTLGVIAYQLLTGRTPFKGSLSKMFYSILTSQAERPSLVGADGSLLDEVILKALNKDPERRYQSTQEMLTELLTAAPSSQRVLRNTPLAKVV